MQHSFLRVCADLVGADHVLDAHSDLAVYECDAFVIEKHCPSVAVFPKNTAEVAAIVKLCNELGVPFVPRGAGTSLAGGGLPVGGGVMIVLTRMREISEVNLRDRYAVVEPGVVNAHLNKRLAGTGFHYAPDPSSQGACTIGGNVSTNAGGPHTLKYGVTVNHVLGVELVTADGEIVQIGGPVEGFAGPDLVGTIVGGEGTLGIVTKIWVRLTRNPQGVRTMLGVFDSVDDATQAISAIIGAGIIPAALEMMDQGILVAVEEAFHFGFPLDAEAILLIEVDGLEVGLDAQRDRVADMCRQHGAREVRFAADAKERLQLWKCRKQAFGAIGRLSPSYCTQDGVVPRSKLPHILQRIRAIGAKYDIRIVNVFHAGDGNFHPILLFDERNDGRDQARAGGERRNSYRVLGLRRQRHRRARHRAREDQLHEPDVHGRRSGRNGAAPRCAESGWIAQPRQIAADGGRLRDGASAPGRGGAVIDCEGS